MRLLAVIGALAASACATVATSPAITGPEWRVAAINGHATPPPPASYKIRFERRTLGGQFGCNHFGGDYRIDGEMLRTSAMMMTEMACADPAGQFEHWGMRVLQQPARMTWQGDDRLVLSNAAGSIELMRQ